jgi:hypothetical protein
MTPCVWCRTVRWCERAACLRQMTAGARRRAVDEPQRTSVGQQGALGGRDDAASPLEADGGIDAPNGHGVPGVVAPARRRHRRAFARITMPTADGGTVSRRHEPARGRGVTVSPRRGPARGRGATTRNRHAAVSADSAPVLAHGRVAAADGGHPPANHGVALAFSQHALPLARQGHRTAGRCRRAVSMKWLAAWKPAGRAAVGLQTPGAWLRTTELEAATVGRNRRTVGAWKGTLGR